MNSPNDDTEDADASGDAAAAFRRIAWRSRRGLLELDLFLEPFLEACWHGLDASGRQAFETLLTYTDPELLEWLSDRQPAPPEVRAIVERIRSHAIHRPLSDRP